VGVRHRSPATSEALAQPGRPKRAKSGANRQQQQQQQQQQPPASRRPALAHRKDPLWDTLLDFLADFQPPGYEEGGVLPALDAFHTAHNTLWDAH
jgi:hypothetical protein